MTAEAPNAEGMTPSPEIAAEETAAAPGAILVEEAQPAAAPADAAVSEEAPPAAAPGDAAVSEETPPAAAIEDAEQKTSLRPEGTGAVAPEEEMSFAEMLAEHEREEAPRISLSPGQRVSVRIVAITGDTIFVSTGSKVDGIVDREELEVDGELPVQVGDSLDLYVVTVSPQEVKLSKILRGAGSISALEEAKEAGLPVEGKVTGQVKGGYAVDVMKRRAFCPSSQIDLRQPEDPEAPVGKTYPFLITRLEKGGRNIVVSRRTLLDREQAENRDALLAQVHVGDVREGAVSRLAPFGAFIELAPGVEGLAHLSELSWARVGQADEAVSVGDMVRFKILGIDKNEKGVRISLSLKQVTDDPWKGVAERLVPGDVVTGKVVRNAPFGSFVEVLPGVDGLVHLSELSFEKRVNRPDEVVVPGDVVSVKIKEVDADKRRISLSLRDAAGNPWDTVTETLPLDMDVTGTMEKRAAFGLFITLSPGITGLMPSGVIQASPARRELERLSPGDAVSVRVKSIDVANRRISLVPAGEAGGDDSHEKDWKRHAPKPASASSMGSLGLALQAALGKKS